MAQRTIVTLTDDLDGSEASTTVAFSYAGKSYEIDLNEQNVAAFEAAVAPYVKAGRRTSGATTRTASRRPGRGASNTDAARTWLRAQGHEVGDRGRIRQDLLDIYNAAH
ncbi:Lsr2 family protein [Cellulomonas sp. HZM]|uniref:histone-like nucleoid-structuring protein Lsr2 n=1 Tax=Cellulomonas sp. HZM TaxID=1454010 RepID=UPI000493244D|nr:Lsr2 family protein [Cellulomonas sp. HZM]